MRGIAPLSDLRVIIICYKFSQRLVSSCTRDTDMRQNSSQNGLGWSRIDRLNQPSLKLWHPIYSSDMNIWAVHKRIYARTGAKDGTLKAFFTFAITFFAFLLFRLITRIRYVTCNYYFTYTIKLWHPHGLSDSCVESSLKLFFFDGPSFVKFTFSSS